MWTGIVHKLKKLKNLKLMYVLLLRSQHGHDSISRGYLVL